MKNDFAVAVKCVVQYGEKVLLLEKTDQEKKGDLSIKNLDLPGGRVKYNEQIEDAVHRELYEETGLEVFEPKIVDAWSIIRPDETHLVIILFKCFCYKDQIRLSNEHFKYWWIDKDSFQDDADIPEWIKSSIYKACKL